MTIISTQENLKSGLQIVSKIVGNSSTLPILNNLLFETENGLLKISGTNLETGISALVPCKVEKEGSFCVGVKTINDLINNLSGNITIESKDEEVNVITTHSNSRIKTLPADDFPSVPKLNGQQKISIDSKQFKNALDQTLFAASIKETKPELCGVLLWFGMEKVLVTATDRYRLAEYSLNYSGGLEQKIIIPLKSAQEISRLLSNYLKDEIEMVVTSTQISIWFDDVYLVARLIEGGYPEYQQIIPDTFNLEINVNKNELLSAVRTSSVFLKSATSINIAYDFSKQMITINSVSHDVGESVIEVPAKISSGEGMIIFNYRYLTDYLLNLSDENLTLKIIDDNSPVVFYPESNNNYLYLVMPINQ